MRVIGRPELAGATRTRRAVAQNASNETCRSTALSSATDARRCGEPLLRPSPPTPAVAESNRASAGRGTAPKTHRAGRGDSERLPQTPTRGEAARLASGHRRRRQSLRKAAESATHEDTIRAPPPRERHAFPPTAAAHAPEQEPQEARLRVGGPRPHRQAPQAPRRPRQRRRPAPHANALRPVPPGLFWQGRHAPVPPDEGALPLPHDQRRDLCGNQPCVGCTRQFFTKSTLRR